MRRSTLLILPLLLASPVHAQTAEKPTTMPTLTYPETRRVNQVDEQFGVKVADPYRWLENDVRSTPRSPPGSPPRTR